jgi:hypothetical protein
MHNQERVTTENSRGFSATTKVTINKESSGIVSRAAKLEYSSLVV